MAKIFSMEDWEKTTIEEVKMRWGNRRREIEEVEKRKREIDEKIEIKKREGKEQLEREGVLCVGYLSIWPVTAEIGKRRRDQHRCP